MTETAPLSVLKQDGTAEKRSDPGLAEEVLLGIHRHMVRVRVLDEKMLMLQRRGEIGFYGPIRGQEASTVASVMALEDEDWVVPALREGYAAAMRGMPLELVVAQLMGSAEDICSGRQMPCHYSWRKGRYVAMSSVIGTQISHAAGLAMAARYRRDPCVVLGFLGDGATSSNDFHAGLNFAAVTKAPVVFFCQNNHWSISVPFEKQTASKGIAVKAAAYGMPGVLVDGNDALAVYAATREAAERARAGDGPTLIESRTYRILGHSSSDDPSRYRDEAEVRAWEERDPIARFRRHLEKRGLWDRRREDALQEEVSQRVNEAIRAARKASPPDPGTLFTDVYKEPTPALLEQRAEAEAG